MFLSINGKKKEKEGQFSVFRSHKIRSSSTTLTGLGAAVPLSRQTILRKIIFNQVALLIEVANDNSS